MKKLDGKCYGVLVKNKNGAIIPPDQWIVFLAKDNALPATLAFYLEECRRQGAAPAQLEAVVELMLRVDTWRRENPTLCKTPDVEPGELQT